MTQKWVIDMIFWGVSDKRLPFGIAVRSRVLQEEGNIATNSAGYSFGVVTPHYDFFLTGLGTSRIEDQFTNTLAAGIDNLQFHDYLFTGVPGSGSKLVRDGQNIGSSKDRTYPFGAPTNYISLGDSTAGTNARAETTAYSFTQPQITTQNPAPGTVVNPGSAVALGIQEGPATQTVPNVVGQTQPNAQAAIGNAGLLVGKVTSEASNIVPAGQVIRQKPVAGTHIMKNFPIDLVLSTGPLASGACIVPPPGLVAWWPGDVSAQDYISANHGTAVNGTNYQVGLVGSGFNFDGIDDYIRVPNSVNLQQNGPFTVEFWLKPGKDFTPAESQGINHYFLAKGSYGLPGGLTSTYGIDTANSDGRIEVNMPTPRPNSIRNTWNSTEWYHAAVTWDGATYRVYVDGVEEGNAANSTSILYTASDVILGWENNFQNHTRFLGVLDEPSIYNRALTATEIQAIFNAGSFGKCKDGIIIADAGPDHTANLNDTVSLNSSASRDLAGNPITYQWSVLSKPANSLADVSNPNSGNPQFIADYTGDYVFQLVVNNGARSSAPDTVRITVGSTTGNHAPSITSTPGTTATTGLLYSYPITATDPDSGDVLTYALLAGPTGMNINASTGLLQWTPTTAQIGTHSGITVNVTDQGGLSATQSFTITVTAANHAPSIAPIPPASVKANELFSYTLQATDPDVGDVLTYALISGPSGMTVDPVTGLVQWIPAVVDIGPHTGITVKVTDKGGLTATQSFDLTVNPADRAPQITSTPPQVATALQVYTYYVIASDPDAGDVLVYSLQTAPSGMTIDTGNGVISWSPLSTDIGLHTIGVRVQDPSGLWIEQTYTLSVVSATIAVPDVTGYTQADAVTLLSANNLILGNVLSAFDEVFAAGVVLSQTPAAGTLASRNSSVNLIVSKGPATVTVPLVVGLPQAAAVNAVNAAKLTLGNVSFVNNDTVAAGLVISQSPISGISVPRGSSVDLVISSGPALITTPNVVGQSQTSAESQLLAANLSVGAVNSISHDTIPAGQVISQSPAAGTAVSKGTAISLVISSGPATNPLTSIRVNPANAVILTGDSLTFSAVGILSDHTSQVLSNPTWSSSNSTVATIDNNGFVSALTEGTSTLSAQQGSVIGSITLTIKAANTTDVIPPTVALITPASGDTVTTPTDVIGTATDANLVKYELAIAPVGQSTFNVIGSGTVGVNNAKLGNLDPTLLLNDLYTLRLTAWDAHNNSATTEIQVQVAREQKVGNFTVAFQDLTVPMACLPVTVTRVYDSRDKQKGDFGVGWKLDVNTIKLRESHTMGQGWSMYLVDKPGPFGILIPTYVVVEDTTHKVSLVLPDGHVEEFDLTLSKTSQSLIPITDVSVSFTPRPGTLGTLAPTGPITWTFDGNDGSVNLRDQDTNLFDPPSYRYTAPDGSVYLIDKTQGVQSVQCNNGQTLSFGPNGISHSGGKNVGFIRDGQGRITSITDPNNKQHHYSYDANGDLSSHTDPVNNVTDFKYDYRHNLIDIVDPRGIHAVRNEYDDAGRLISTTDPAGKAITYTHDLVSRTETITDRLGNVTVHGYDQTGNVVETTDALGNVTKYNYDAFGNQTDKIDPLNRLTHFEYDSRRNVLNETDPLGNITKYTYSPFNDVSTVTDPLNRVTSNNYDSKGNLTSTVDPLNNTTTYTYDTGGLILPNTGLMTSKTDALNHKTAYEHDANGNLSKEIDALGHVSSYDYDANGNRTQQTTTRTKADSTVETLITKFEYDAMNRLVKTTQPDGSTTQTVYNAIGKQEQTIDAQNRTTSYTYDDQGRLTKTTYPDGIFETSSYDAEGRRTSSTDRAGRTTTYTYDVLGRLIKTTFPDNTSTQTAYDAAGQVSSTTDALGHVTRYVYDDAGRRTKVIDASNNAPNPACGTAGVTCFTYDAAGNQTDVTDANGHVTHFTYDAGNRRTQVTYPDTSFDQTVYDALGRNTSKIDQDGKATQFGYDELGRLVKVTDALNQITSYGYDELGQQITQTDANGHITQFSYDSMGRRIRRTLPLGQTESMVYDVGGNLSAKTDFNGKTTTFAYDNLNRLITKTPDVSLGQPAVSYTYTVSGQRESMDDASGTTTYSYDNRDRLTAKATPQGTLNYTYNGAGNLASIDSGHLNGVSLDYSYDVLNRLASVKDNNLANGITTYQYDFVGSLAGYDYPNGVTTRYTYNSLNRLTDMHVDVGATPLASYAYTLGKTGNRLSVAELGGRTVNYTYDELYRLKQEQITADPHSINGQVDYTYDPVGNRKNRTSTLSGIANQSFTYNQNDQLNTDTYDANGNTTGASGKTYAYDYENHLTAQNAGQVAIVYDGDGNRVSETVGGVTTQYLVDTLNPTGYAQVLEEIENGAVVRRYSYGSDLISQSLKNESGWNTSFYLYDGHGSVRQLTDEAGVVTDTYDYEAFGNLLYQSGTTPNKYLYSGEQRDFALGLDYLRARWLNQDSGRFITRDMLLGTPEDPMSLHLYIYALGNPINNSDPIGLSPLLEEVGTVSIRAELEGLIRGSQQQFLARQIMARIGWRIELAVFKVFAIAVAIGVQTSVDLFKDIAKRKTGAANVFFPGLDTLKTTDHIRDAIASGHSVILHRKKPPHSRSWIYNTGGCRLNWASVTGLECDEYPFANSEEGGRLGSPTPSTRLVPDWEQNRQGGLLSSFFDACDIKPNDSLRGGFAVVPTYLPFTTWTCRR